METKTTNGLTQTDSKQATPSPEDRVRAMTAEELLTGLLVGFVRSEGRPFTDEYNCARAELISRLSLVEELIPFCDSPCGHTSQYAYSVDGGKNIVCLICEREELKGQATVSASPQPTQDQVTTFFLNRYGIDLQSDMWNGQNMVMFALAVCKEFFPAAPTAEAEAALTKRKDYHAEYVEAVEAAVKAQGELEVMREALRRLRNNAMQGKVTSALIYEVDVFLFPALTPEPASQAAEEKK